MKKGWESKLFEDCLDKVNYTNKIQRTDFLESGKFPIISQEQEFVNGYWDDSKDLFKVKKPVIIFGDHTQVLKYIDFDFVLGADGVKILQPFNDLIPKYFYYFMSNINLIKLGYARHYRLLKELSIPIPPLPEQQRIIAILDEAFNAIATAKANAEKNLQNARDLFESYLESIFANQEPENKSWSLNDICLLIVDCEHNTAPTQEDGYPSIRTPNIGRGSLFFEGVNRVSVSTYKEWTKRAVPQAEDLILAREAPAGNVAVIPKNIQVCLGQRTVLIRPRKEIINSYYLMYLLLSNKTQTLLLSNSRGATVTHVNMKDIRSLKIDFIPSVVEQLSIVVKLDTLSSETKKLEAIYQKKLAYLEELKKSILQKAFEGELTRD